MSSGRRKIKALSLGLAAMLCATSGFSAPAHADNYYNNGHDNDHNSDNRHDNHNEGNYSGHLDNNRSDHDRDRIIIGNDDRQAINDYMRNHHRHHHNDCPPGLARKHNGCLPPGQEHRYEIGQRLPPNVSYVLVPYSLRHHLQPARTGYEYVRVDDDVLLMSKRDRTIVDAVALLSDLAH